MNTYYVRMIVDDKTETQVEVWADDAVAAKNSVLWGLKQGGHTGKVLAVCKKP